MGGVAGDWVKTTMFYSLKRHPFPVEAHFKHCLVLAYTFPESVLAPLLPPGLTLDPYEDRGFVAVALVETEHLRPAGMPAALGQNFILTGYRIFARYRTPEGRNLRGLYILRSDTDRALMTALGNQFTHYQYHHAHIAWEADADELRVSVKSDTPGEADLLVTADLTSIPAPLPPGSPLPDLKTARRYAGPLPFTFDYEKETGSIIRVQGKRAVWEPQPVRVSVERCTFLDHPMFGGVAPVLANAFHVQDIEYRWEAGVVAPAVNSHPSDGSDAPAEETE